MGPGGRHPCPSRRVALGQSVDVPVNSRRTPLGARGPQELRQAVGARLRGASLRAGGALLRTAWGAGGSDCSLGGDTPLLGLWCPMGRQLCYKGFLCSCLSNSDLEWEVLAGIQPTVGARGLLRMQPHTGHSALPTTHVLPEPVRLPSLPTFPASSAPGNTSPSVCHSGPRPHSDNRREPLCCCQALSRAPRDAEVRTHGHASPGKGGLC